MPYIGNSLATQFQAFATQTITGDGSTGYTLDRAVANGKELLVYINNVKQEEGSGKSYTASGTTITFSEAVTSGDSCYLVYLGSAVQTVTAPEGSIVSSQFSSADLSLTSATTITVSDNSDNLTLTSTDADANAGPNLRLYRNSASPADVDRLGHITFDGRNDNSQDFTAAQIQVFTEDASDGTEDSSVTFTCINAGAANNAMQINPTETVFNESRVDRDFRIESASEGNIFFVEAGTSRIGIGTTSPTAQLQCEGGSVVFKNTTTNIGSTVHHYVNSVSNGAYRIRFDSNDNVVGSIGVGTSSTAFNTSSDYRLKENVTYDFDATTRVKKLKPARFSWVKDKKSDATQDGFIAHEVSDVVPEAVTGTKDAMMALEYQRDDVIPEGKKLGDFKGYSKTEIEPQTLDYSKVVPLLTKALQEAISEIDTLKEKVKALESK